MTACCPSLGGVSIGRALGQDDDPAGLDVMHVKCTACGWHLTGAQPVVVIFILKTQSSWRDI